MRKERRILEAPSEKEPVHEEEEYSNGPDSEAERNKIGYLGGVG